MRCGRQLVRVSLCATVRYLSNARRNGGGPCPPPPRSPVAPPPPSSASIPSPHAQNEPQTQVPSASPEGWEDIMFFDLNLPNTPPPIATAVAAASPLLAMNLEPTLHDIGDRSDDSGGDVFGIGAALDVAQDAAAAAETAEAVPSTLAAAPSIEEDAPLSTAHPTRDGAVHPIHSTLPSEHRAVSSWEKATEEDEADTFDTYFRAHHAEMFHDSPDATDRPRDPLEEAEAAMRAYRAMRAAMDGAGASEDLRGQHKSSLSPPVRRSSRAFLAGGDEDGEGIACPPVADFVAEEAEQEAQAAAAEAALVAASWAKYLPSDEQQQQAMAAAEMLEQEEEDVALEEGEEDEDARLAREKRERFWWQQPPQLVGAPVLPPLRIPDKDGHVAEAKLVTEDATAEEAKPHGAGDAAAADDPHSSSNSKGEKMATDVTSAVAVLPPFPPVAARMAARPKSFLAQQDLLYLAPQTPAEAQVPMPSSLSLESRGCVMVVFAANDLRVHDNYALALAAMRAHTAGGLPVVAVCVLDYRTFAQPSVVGGFFRQSPLRASFLLETVAALREKLETEYHVPLLVRVGRPEEHVPRLAIELGAVDVFLTTQYAPHERRVHDAILRAIRRGSWVSRHELRGDELTANSAEADAEGEEEEADPDRVEELDEGYENEEAQDLLIRVEEHDPGHGDLRHPYGPPVACARQGPSGSPAVAVPHSVWQTTLVHLDDLPTPVAAMKEGERWYHDDVTIATIRPTKPYDRQIDRLKDLPCWSDLLPAATNHNTVVRGVIPTLFDLGYARPGANQELARLLITEELIATQSSHPSAGEDAAMARVQDWLADGGLTSMLRYGRPRRGNTKLYSQKLSRVSPYLAVGALSPRKFYEMIRAFAHENLRDGFVQMQYREALLRLSRRDYWHWMGLRFGDQLFYSYGPHPDRTDSLPDWRRDPKIVQKWCTGLTGIPFADAAMKELRTTGYVAHEGRQALIWLLVRGYGQDWRLGAEWLERCSLDYDPFLCYGNAAYYTELIPDDFGETVRNVHYLAHHHDQTGIYIKKWLPQLSKVPPVYVHRPHVLTPRMQAMHGVYLGRNYPYPLKLWDGAQRALGPAELPSYFAGEGLTTPQAVRHPPDTAAREAPAATGASDAYEDKNHKAGPALGPGYAEAVRCGVCLMEPEELSTAVHPHYLAKRQWARAFLPDATVAALGWGSIAGAGENDGEEEEVLRSYAGRRAQKKRLVLPTDAEVAHYQHGG